MKCECSEFFGEACQSDEPADTTCWILPAQHRGTAEALGDRTGLEIKIAVTTACWNQIVESEEV